MSKGIGVTEYVDARLIAILLEQICYVKPPLTIN